MKARIGTVALAVLALAATVTLAGCVMAGAVTNGGHATGLAAQQPGPKELRVSAATSLKAVFERLAPGFETATGARVVFAFGASGLLQKQIEGGAPCDVFASASPKQVDALISGGLVSTEETASFAGNDLVVFVAKGNPEGITSPADLVKAERLTTGNPATAPHGAKAKEWLMGLGTWEGLQQKFAFAENAAQTLDYVARGEADAGIGFASEVKGKDTVEVVYTVPKGEITPIRYVAAPLKVSSDPELARKFVAYLLSAEGQKSLIDAGFLPPPAK